MTAGAGDVLITGCGVISPWGIGLAAFADGLRHERSAVGASMGTADTRSYSAAEVSPFEPATLLPGTKGLREFDRTSLLLASATAMTLSDAGGPPTADVRRGLVVGSTYGPIGSIAEFDLDAVRDGPSGVRPLAFPNTVLNAAAGRIGKLFGLKGVNCTISTGETSALDAFIYAADWLRDGRADSLLTGGGFGLSGVVRDALPTVLGEGAAMFLLEAGPGARGRRIYARIAGFADAFLPAASDGVGLAARAVTDALHRAGRRPTDVDLVITGDRSPAHCSGLEEAALRDAFGAALPPRQSLRALLGDCLDAAGAFQVVAALLALKNGARAVLVTAMARAGHSAFVVLDREGAVA